METVIYIPVSYMASADKLLLSYISNLQIFLLANCCLLLTHTTLSGCSTSLTHSFYTDVNWALKLPLSQKRTSCLHPHRFEQTGRQVQQAHNRQAVKKAF